MSIYKEHLVVMKEKIQLLDEIRIKLVSLINCERQLFSYEKDVFSYYWYDQDFFRNILDNAWFDLLGGDKLSVNLEPITKHFSQDYAGTNLALYFCDSIDALSEVYKNELMNENSVKICTMGLCIVDALAYDILDIRPSSSSDLTAHNSELFTTEVKRQERVVSRVSEIDISKESIISLKSEFEGDDITLGYWFSE